MSWAKFDDRYDDTRKVKRAWRDHPRAVGMHAMAITYCARHENDGRVDLEWIEEKLPNKRERDDCLRVLVDTRLFEIYDESHYTVHDYLDYNPSRGDLEERRERDRQRKSEGGSRRIPHGFRAESKRSPSDTPQGIQAESGSPVPSRPVPVVPDPTTGRKEGGLGTPPPSPNGLKTMGEVLAELGGSA